MWQTWNRSETAADSAARRLWRWTGVAGSLLLRLWPEGYDAKQLADNHRLMADARNRGLQFVPLVIQTRLNVSLVTRLNRLWELQEWLPGVADFHGRPARQKLEQASTALAQLHQVWSRYRDPVERQCPAIQRRLDFVRSWIARRHAGWRPRSQDASLQALLASFWTVVDSLVDHIAGWLRPWSDRLFPAQPCLRDPWHDHFLFENDRLTGLIDYGSVNTDNVAVDLARMLGSLVGDDEASWQLGFDGYRSIRALSAEEMALARALDRAGTVVAAATWLIWLTDRKGEFSEPLLAVKRLDGLMKRLVRFIV